MMNKSKILEIALWGIIFVFTVIGVFVMFCNFTFMGRSIMLCKYVMQTVGGLFGTGTEINDKQDTLRFIGWCIGGLLAAIGATAISRRADAQVENNKLIDRNNQQAEKRHAENNQLVSENNRLVEEKHIDERIRAANEDMASNRAETRVTAFYQFYRLAKDNKDENFRKSIFDILCSHIRQTTNDDEYKKNNKGKPSEEVQTLLDILFKSEDKTVFAKMKTNLRRAHLAGADLSKAHLLQTDFSGACLIGVNLNDAKMYGCNFTNTKMHGASLWDTNMQYSKFIGTKMPGSILRDTNMQLSQLGNDANLQGCYMSNVYMQGVVLASGPSSSHYVYIGGAFQYGGYDDYESTIIKQAEQDGDFEGITYFGDGGPLRLHIHETVEFLKKYGDEKLVIAYQDHQGILEKEIDKPPKYVSRNDSFTLTPYTKEEAEKWIAEYNEVMEINPTTENT